MGGVRSMARMALRGTSWSHLLDYASPALFDVIPARALLAQSRELFANRGDAARFSAVREHVGTILRARGIEVEITSGPRRDDELALTELSEADRRELGQRILDIFFTQVFESAESILDLRSENLGATERGALSWRPGALYVRWQPDFLAGLRDLYRGFYLGDEARFQEGLRQLQLESSGDPLRRLLGKDDPSNTRFHSATFHESFHELFVDYRDRGISIHRNFLPLGVSLMSLYDTLDPLDVPLSVEAAVRGHAPPSQAV